MKIASLGKVPCLIPYYFCYAPPILSINLLPFLLNTFLLYLPFSSQFFSLAYSISLHIYTTLCTALFKSFSILVKYFSLPLFPFEFTF